MFLASAVQCGEPGAPENGAKDGHVYFHPHNVTYTCFAGFVMRGDKQIHCDKEGYWTSMPPVCEGTVFGPLHLTLTIFYNYIFTKIMIISFIFQPVRLDGLNLTQLKVTVKNVHSTPTQ